MRKKEKYVILIHQIQFFASGVPAKEETKGLENIEQKCNCGLIVGEQMGYDGHEGMST